jgi:hypothetical protein
MQFNFKQYVLKHPDKLLSAILYFVALHSILTGLALVVQPTWSMKLVGFSPICERFFPTQGGVFHIVMAVAYVMGAINAQKYYHVIVFAIIVKTAATLFLFTYCLTVEFKWIILLFGIGDGLMGLMIFFSFQYYLYFSSS